MERLQKAVHFGETSIYDILLLQPQDLENEMRNRTQECRAQTLRVTAAQNQLQHVYHSLMLERKPMESGQRDFRHTFHDVAVNKFGCTPDLAHLLVEPGTPITQRLVWFQVPRHLPTKFKMPRHAYRYV